MYKNKFFKENLINGNIVEDIIYVKNNDKISNLSNLEVPSRVIYYYNEYNQKIIEEIDYLYRGKFHRENGPARLFLYDNGQIKEEHYYNNGMFYPNEEGFTIKKFFKNKQLKSTCKQLDKDNIFVINYSKKGFKTNEKYFLDGRLHRLDGAAMTIYYQTKENRIKEQYWYRYGKLHRLYEPAVQYDNNGNKISAFYLDGIRYDDSLKHAIASATFEN